MKSGMRFGTAVLARHVYCRLDATPLEQMRAKFTKAELLGSRFAPLRADQARSVKVPALLITGPRIVQPCFTA
jgi:hypothetical protein